MVMMAVGGSCSGYDGGRRLMQSVDVVMMMGGGSSQFLSFLIS